MKAVQTSADFGNTWVETKSDPSVIMVIGPGAGMMANALAYEQRQWIYLPCPME